EVGTRGDQDGKVEEPGAPRRPGRRVRALDQLQQGRPLVGSEAREVGAGLDCAQPYRVLVELAQPGQIGDLETDGAELGPGVDRHAATLLAGRRRAAMRADRAAVPRGTAAPAQAASTSGGRLDPAAPAPPAGSPVAPAGHG